MSSSKDSTFLKKFVFCDSFKVMLIVFFYTDNSRGRIFYHVFCDAAKPSKMIVQAS